MDPYIGVTGFMTRIEVNHAIATLDRLEREHKLSQHRRLMVGVLASSKTLAGGTNKYPKRYPKVEEIASIFPPDRRTLNLIHYATDDKDTLPEQIKKLIELGGPHLDGFQFNIAWPDPNAIKVFRKRVVLQLGAHALAECDHDPKTVAERVSSYREVATDVLIDMSGGKGIPMDFEKTLAYLQALDGPINVGIAGGLCAGTLEPVRKLIDLYDDALAIPFSIDAEGKIRNDADDLDLGAVDAFISEAYKIFR